jgi:hypothetical protein
MVGASPLKGRVHVSIRDGALGKQAARGEIIGQLQSMLV